MFPKSGAMSLYSMLKVVKAAMLIRSISGSGNYDRGAGEFDIQHASNEAAFD